MNKKLFKKKKPVSKLLAGTLLLSLLFPLTKTKAENSKTLEEKIPYTSINLEYLYKTNPLNIEYNFINQDLKPQNTPLFQISQDQISEIELIKDKIKKIEIPSYKDLLKESENLSTNQYFILSSQLMNLADEMAHRNNTKSYSQEEFFQMLLSNILNPYSVQGAKCGGISNFIAQFLEDNNIPAAVINTTKLEEGHYNVIGKGEKGITIIGENNIFVTDTNNTKKALEKYQSEKDIPMFEYTFYNKEKLRYVLLTRQGENYLKFIDHDPSLKTLEEKLTKDHKENPKIKIDLHYDKNLIFGRTNLNGFLINIGEIKQTDSSKNQRLDLYQIGFKKSILTSKEEYLNFILRNKKIDFEFFYIKGKFKFNSDKIEETTYKKIRETKYDNLNAILFDLKISTNNKKGFNFGTRISDKGTLRGNFPEQSGVNLFQGYPSLEAGTSYSLPIKRLTIIPYTLAQKNFMRESFGGESVEPYISEFKSGIKTELHLPKKSLLSLNYSYTKRPWEKEYTTGLSFETKKIKSSIENSKIKSSYYFCPDKNLTQIELDYKFSNYKIGGFYKYEKTNYEGEKEKQHSINARIGINF